MTQEEILEYNRRCTELLFPELIDIDDTGIWGINTYLIENKKSKYEILSGHWSNIFIDIDLKFHSDWNWIMEVVEVVLKLPNIKKQEDTTQQSKRIVMQAYLGRANKEAVVQAINQFLIWYENETDKIK
jgi:hypothetical protein